MIAPRTVAELIGAEYVELRATIEKAIEIRNKLVHGQITQRGYITRDELFAYVAGIRRWCQLLASAALSEVGYDGFQRNSFRKGRPNIASSFRIQLADIDGYKQLLGDHVARRRNGNWKPAK